MIICEERSAHEYPQQSIIEENNSKIDTRRFCLTLRSEQFATDTMMECAR